MIQTTHMAAPRMATALGLVAAAVGLIVQYVSGVDFPTIPPGPILLAAAAGVVAFLPRWWAPAVGLVVALFIAVGGVVATASGGGFDASLGAPGELGAFAGGLVQVAGLVLALVAGALALRGERA